MSVVEQGRERRAKARLHRIDIKRQEILEEQRGQPLMEGESLNLGGIGNVSFEQLHQRKVSSVEPEALKKPLSKFEAMTAQERFELHAAYSQGYPIPEDDRHWFNSYVKTAEYRTFKRREAEQQAATWGVTASL